MALDWEPNLFQAATRILGRRVSSVLTLVGGLERGGCLPGSCGGSKEGLQHVKGLELELRDQDSRVVHAGGREGGAEGRAGQNCGHGL